MTASPFDRPTYLDKFGLKEPPYSTNPDERFLFLTDNHQEAMAMAARVITQHEGAALIYGEKGTGKTTIMRRLITEMSNLPDRFHIATIAAGEHCPTPFQLVQEVIEGFGGECRSNNRKGRYDQLKAILLEDYKQNIIPVLLIDEAQQLEAQALESLRGYLNFETATEKVLQIILFAMPNIVRKLAYVPSLRNRLVRTELDRMSEAVLAKMLEWRFIQAGGKVFPFEVEAMQALYQLTKGHPRTACGIAVLALEVAAARNTFITPSIIQEAANKRFVD
ncbi:MAG: ATP-binding protein [Anaerolineae bacterium]|nr:ATP-binding protein [Anaerolineae bacterium]